MSLFIFILGLSMTEIRVDCLLDTTAKLVPLYSEMEGVDTLEAVIFELTNIERKKKGLKNLKFEKRLRIAARQHSNEMLEDKFLSHGSSNILNKTSVQRIYNSGLPILKVGENVAEDVGDLIPFLLSKDIDSLAKRIVNGWMESPGHRKNILEPGFTHMGVGSIIEGETHKVTQNFADCSDFMVDSVLAKVKEGKYLLLIFMSSLISDIRVFDDGKPMEEDSLHLYSGLIEVPLRRDSSLHKIELCLKEKQLYRCGIRLFIHTGSRMETIFQPASSSYK
jgi:uncharacterized protein YkwD